MAGDSQDASQRWWCWGLVGLEEATEESIGKFRVEDRDPLPFWGEGVGVGVGNACDESMQAESAQVVAHLVRAVVSSEHSGHQPSEAFVGEAVDGVD